MSEQERPVDREDWADETTRRIGRRIAEVRAARRTSAQALADLTAELGHEVPRGAIAKIENGRRGISAPELLVLARGLSIPPWALLVDLDSDDDVWSIPGLPPGHPWDFVRWWQGDFVIQLVPPRDEGSDDSADPSSQPFPGAERVTRWRRFEELWSRVVHLDMDWRVAEEELEKLRKRAQAEAGSVPVWAEQYADRIRSARAWVAATRAELDRAVGELRSDWIHEVTVSGRGRWAAELGTLDLDSLAPTGDNDGDDQ